MTTPLKARMKSVSVPVKVNAERNESEGPPEFEAVAYSGGILPGYTTTPRFDLDYVIDLQAMTQGRSPKVNQGHDPDKRVGHEISFENSGKELVVRGVLSAVTAYRDEIVDSAKNGYPWEVSQEASLLKIRKLAAGKKALVNGQEFTGPLYIVGQSVHEALAFVTTGADEGNSVSVAATAAGANEMTDFEKWLVDGEFDPDSMSEKQKATMQAAYDSQKNGSTAAPTAESRSAGQRLSDSLASERANWERESEITRLAHDEVRHMRVQGREQFAVHVEAMAKKAIDDKNTTIKDFELELLRVTRVSASSFRPPTQHEPDAKVVECALARAVGLPNIEKHYKPEVLEAVDRDPRLRHFSLQQCMMKVACANGYDGQPGERITNGNLKRVLRFAFPDDDGPVHTMRGTQFSTINLPGVFGNVANKELVSGFEEEDMSWKQISRLANATNFHTRTAYRLTDTLEYELLPKGGEIKHGKLGEESYSMTLKTYAKMLGLDRQDIINDDLSAFDDLRTRLGRGAARKFNNVFWLAFLNNANFFTTARTNYIEGATTNLGTDGVGLGLGVAQFKKMESVDGKRIGGQPTIVLVPPELEVIADKLYTGGNGQFQTPANTNTFIGKYRPVVVPWLSDTDFSGYSTTAWYLFRQASVLAPMVVSFLNGNQTPTVESTDADFNNLGILFRGYHDFSADQAEYLSGLKSKGAA